MNDSPGTHHEVEPRNPRERVQVDSKAATDIDDFIDVYWKSPKMYRERCRQLARKGTDAVVDQPCGQLVVGSSSCPPVSYLTSRALAWQGRPVGLSS